MISSDLCYTCYAVNYNSDPRPLSLGIWGGLGGTTTWTWATLTPDLVYMTSANIAKLALISILVQQL